MEFLNLKICFPLTKKKKKKNADDLNVICGAIATTIKDYGEFNVRTACDQHSLRWMVVINRSNIWKVVKICWSVGRTPCWNLFFFFVCLAHFCFSEWHWVSIESYEETVSRLTLSYYDIIIKIYKTKTTTTTRDFFYWKLLINYLKPKKKTKEGNARIVKVTKIVCFFRRWP